MNQRVLLVGDDESVFQTRALLLHPLEVIQSSAADSPARLFSQSLDVVVVVQSVVGPTAEWIIAAVKSLERVPALILIRFPGAEARVDHDRILSFDGGLAWGTHTAR